LSSSYRNGLPLASRNSADKEAPPSLEVADDTGLLTETFK